jgi:hypothetical protein
MVDNLHGHWPMDADDVEKLAAASREVERFAAFAKKNPNSRLFVKRWNHTLRSYDCGYVLIVDAKLFPTIYVDDSSFKFDDVTAMIVAGWIGD